MEYSKNKTNYEYKAKLKLLKKQGYFWNRNFIEKNLLTEARNAILEYSKLDVEKKLTYNYGDSEIRIHNSQDLIP